MFKSIHLAALCGLAALIGGLVSTSSAAPVSYGGGVLTENFDSMGSAGTTVPNGWSVQIGGGNDVPAGPTAAYTAATTTVTADNGSLAPAAGVVGYNYGLTGDGNRSLGSAATGNSRSVDWAIVNNSGSPIPAFRLGYTGRKWRQGSAQVQIDRFDLYFSPDGVTWTAFGSNFRYSSPNDLPNSSVRNGLTNFIVLPPQNFGPSAAIAAGSTFYIRFWDHNPGDTDGGIAVDDVSFQADVIQPIVITQQPVGVTVAEGGSATFSVAVTGSAPMYQWFENGSPIVGSNGPTLVINPALRGRDLFEYFVRVSNIFPSSVDSDHVILDVLVDLQRPTFLCAYQGASASQIIVVYSEVVSGATDNFDFDLSSPDGGSLPAIAAMSYQGGGTSGTTVIFDLDQPMQAGKAYMVNFGLQNQESIVDVFGNFMAFPASVAVGRHPLDMVRVNATQQWRYEASGADQGTAWRAPGFIDSGWSNGLAVLAVETAGPSEPIRTVFTPYNSAIITYYFRTHFNFDGPAGNGVVQLRTIFDDGGTIYLNGTEIYRLRMPAGNPLYTTLATGGPAVDPTPYEGPFTVCVSNLVHGDNVIAVEVHQNAGGSSDIVMGLEAIALLPAIVPVSFVQQPMDVTVAEGGSATFSVVASGSSVQYQWYGPAGLIAGATASSLTINPAVRADQGNYHVDISNLASGPLSSANAHLEILEDLTSATIVCAYSTNNAVVVVFSEPTTNANNPALYTVTGSDSSTVVVTAANYDPAGLTGNTVVITLQNPPPPGLTYTVTATGFTDIYGNPNTQTVPFALYGTSLKSLTDTWRYDTSGTDRGTGWSAPGFIDTAWPSGPGVFDGKRAGGGSAGVDCRDTVSGIAVGTCITTSNAMGTAQIPSAYFRTHFAFAGNPTNAVICIRPVLDDGAVFYLNGVEIMRPLMSAGPVSFTTMTGLAAVGDANFTGPYYVCVTNLIVGDNVLAASVHQVNLTGSDLTFGGEVSVLVTIPPVNITLTVELVGSNVRVTWSGGGTLIATDDPTLPRSSWTPVAAATSPYVTPASLAKRFYAVQYREFSNDV